MSNDTISPPHLFTLTKITGRERSKDREVPILTIDVGVQTRNTFVLGLIPTLPIAGFFGLLIGPYAILLWAGLMGGWFVLLTRRSTSGMRTKTWETIRDRKLSLAGKFIQCGVALTDAHFAPYQVMGSTVPLERPDDLASAFDRARKGDRVSFTENAMIPSANIPPRPAPRAPQPHLWEQQ